MGKKLQYMSAQCNMFVVVCEYTCTYMHAVAVGCIWMCTYVHVCVCVCVCVYVSMHTHLPSSEAFVCPRGIIVNG